MAEGRGSAAVAIVLLSLMVVAYQCEVAQAATYVVGDNFGWTFGSSRWGKDKKFMAGDVLVFNYFKGLHNVVAVNKEGLESCSVNPSDAKVYTSGHDQITLVKGLNNFICSIPLHCLAGMHIQILAD